MNKCFKACTQGLFLLKCGSSNLKWFISLLFVIAKPKWISHMTSKTPSSATIILTPDNWRDTDTNTPHFKLHPKVPGQEGKFHPSSSSCCVTFGVSSQRGAGATTARRRRNTKWSGQATPDEGIRPATQIFDKQEQLSSWLEPRLTTIKQSSTCCLCWAF